MPKKWVQVILGRWVHILQFRRAGMAGLHWVWKYISNKKLSAGQMVRVRKELCMLMAGACLFHTFLGSEISGVTTASDASGSGGAVGKSTRLSPVGQDLSYLVRERKWMYKSPNLGGVALQWYWWGLSSL